MSRVGEFAHNHPRMFTAGVAAGLGVMAIGGNAVFANPGSPSATGDAVPVTAAPLTTEQIAGFNEVCVDGFSIETPIAQEFSLTVVGAPDALGSSNRDAKGNLIIPAQFGDKLLAEACKKPDYLATITAFAIEPANNETFPDAKTLNRVKELTALYRSNPDAALAALNDLASVVKAKEGVSINPNFFLIDTKGAVIAPTRDANNIATGEHFEQLNDGGFREVFLLNYDLTDKRLNTTDISNRIALSDLVGFDTDGRVILKQWFGDNNVDLTPETTSPETTAVATTVADTGETIPVEPSTSSSSPDSSTPENGTTANTTGNSTGTTAGTTGGNGKGGGNGGGGNAPTKPSSPDAPGAPDTVGTPTDIPGTIPGGPGTTGPNTTGPGTTTPNTEGTTTTLPRSTTTTTSTPEVSTTTPNTVGTTTTTTTTIPSTTLPKGTQPPCVSNPPFVICPPAK